MMLLIVCALQLQSYTYLLNSEMNRAYVWLNMYRIGLYIDDTMKPLGGGGNKRYIKYQHK